MVVHVEIESIKAKPYIPVYFNELVLVTCKLLNIFLTEKNLTIFNNPIANGPFGLLRTLEAAAALSAAETLAILLYNLRIYISSVLSEG